MLFSTPVFIFLFLPICLLIYYGSGKSNIVLLSFSLLFYAWGEPILVFVMIGSIIVNYILGLCIEGSQVLGGVYPKAFLMVGICANLLLLGFYKYYNFIALVFNNFSTVFNISPIQQANIPLLLGVSFFTFQAMSYLIDVYRRDYPAQKNVFKFALFKTLFPQLIAGPIVRYAEFGYQIDDRKHGIAIFTEGVEQFTRGLAKKVLIADVCAVSVDRMFEIPVTDVSGSVAWVATFLFSIQIFFDFSGYTDMALGLGKMFGFRFPPNFNYPYSALSIQDFWRRWHMTLSRWFRDYLYIPLGGSRKGEWRTALNLFIVFFLCGLWHGANTTFIVWGLFHGFFLAIERTSFRRWVETWPLFSRHIYVLSVIMFSWMIFRASSLDQAVGIAKAMLGANGWTNEHYLIQLYVDNLTLISALLGTIFSFPIYQWIYKKFKTSEVIPRIINCIPESLTPVIRAITYSMLLLVCYGFVGAQTHRAFIYFRF